MLHPVKKQNRGEAVYNQMLKNIVDGVWQEGHKISSETVLCETFDVSRATVREVIHRLSALGVIESHQGKGTFVKKLDFSFYFNLIVPSLLLNEDDGSSLVAFMKAIQVESVRQISKTATPQDLAEIQEDFRMMQVNETGDQDAFSEHDFSFHRHVVALTGNDLFIRATDLAERLLHVYLYDIVKYNGGQESLHQHQQCLDALLVNDTNTAVAAIAEHYDMILIRLQKWLALSESERLAIRTRKV